MNENRTVHLVEIPFGGKGGLIWNRLHGEREDISEALLKTEESGFNERREQLHERLRKLDDALDRLMSGSYGLCSKCRRSIEETKLDIDPALAVCLECSGDKSDAETIMLAELNPFDTIILKTLNSDYRILLLEPETGRSLVEGGAFLKEPAEGLLMGCGGPGCEFQVGVLGVGSRLEMWVGERMMLTSPITAVHIERGAAAESPESISAALH